MTIAGRIDGPIGKVLEGLTIGKVTFKMETLVGMRLIDATEKKAYQVHPAVRDGFLNGMDPLLRKRAHAVVRSVFGDRLPSGLRIDTGWDDGLGAKVRLFGEPNYSNDPSVLDRLEEIVYHTLQDGRIREAWSIYLYRMGAFGHIGLVLAAFEKGMRICRMIVERDSAAEGASRLGPLERQNALHDIGLYALHLGDPVQAARDLGQTARTLEVAGERVAAAISKYSEAEAYVLLGHLANAKRAAEEAARLSQNDAGERGQALAYLAHVHALWGDRKSPDEVFGEVQRIQDQIDRKHGPLYGHQGVFQALMKLRLGELKDAEAITRANLETIKRHWGPLGRENQQCRLVLASIACSNSDWNWARAQLAQAFDWAVNRDAKAMLSGAARVKAEILIKEGQAGQSQPSAEAHSAPPVEWAEARKTLEEGLRMARSYGYGIDHIDLLNLSALLHLLEGKPLEAERDARMALTDGWKPADQSGRPRLIAAADDECRYVWGEATARQRLAEALLLQTAEQLSSRQLPAGVATNTTTKLRDSAVLELEKALDLRTRIGDPQTAETRATQEDLQKGILTRYPLPVAANEPGTNPEKSRRFRVALSFTEKNDAFVAQIAAELAHSLGKERVFYYKYFLAELARPNLDTYLQNIYHHESEIIVVFLSVGYEASEFCRLEWRVVRELIKKRSDESIMPVRFDDTHVSGLFSIDGYLDAKKLLAKDIAGYIIERLERAVGVG